MLDVREGRLEPQRAAEVVRTLSTQPSAPDATPAAVLALGHSNLDLEREARCGFPEVVFAQGKQIPELVEIAAALESRHGRFLATRVDPSQAGALLQRFPHAVHHTRARIVCAGMPDQDRGVGRVVVVAAGTSDRAVADEASITARAMGAHVEELHDVGVAGLHRLLAHVELLRSANALVVVAGMEGALASVVGGLVARPVIAVPTSVGYGAAFEGLAALLSMLNSCAAGVSVVNIDNGFGAGYSAAQINRMAQVNR